MERINASQILANLLTNPKITFEIGSASLQFVIDFMMCLNHLSKEDGLRIKEIFDKQDYHKLEHFLQQAHHIAVMCNNTNINNQKN